MDALSLTLAFYSAQLMIVVCIAALGELWLRSSTPAVRLAYWHAVLVLCLALPFLEPAPTRPTSISVAFGVVDIGGGSIEQKAPTPASIASVVVWTGGVAFRLVWLLAGAWGLRQLRWRSAPAALGLEVDMLRRDIASHAEIRSSNLVRQPVTFGARQPVILLPQKFAELDLDARRAVACHELLHVARRDWARIVLEEMLRTLFWFHPGMWWLVERVQLTREQVIDRLVVQRTGSKHAYMTALMTFADRGPANALAMAFLRRRHLNSRFRELSQETHMSLRRLAFTATLLTTAVCGAALAAARELPLNLGSLARQAGRAARLEIRLAEASPAAGLTEETVSGSNERVYVYPTALATEADVTSARVVDLGGSQFGVGLAFSAPAAARMAGATAAHLARPVAIVLDGRVVTVLIVRAAIGDSAVISGGFTSDQARELAARFSAGRAARAPQGGDVTLPTPIYQAKASYPAAAMAARIEGSVLLEVVVLKDGSTGTVTVVESLDPTLGLDQEAVNALKQWTWKPGTKDGKPVDVAVKVEITFALK